MKRVRIRQTRTYIREFTDETPDDVAVDRTFLSILYEHMAPTDEGTNTVEVTSDGADLDALRAGYNTL